MGKNLICKVQAKNFNLKFECKAFLIETNTQQLRCLKKPSKYGQAGMEGIKPIRNIWSHLFILTCQFVTFQSDRFHLFYLLMGVQCCFFSIKILAFCPSLPFTVQILWAEINLINYKLQLACRNINLCKQCQENYIVRSSEQVKLTVVNFPLSDLNFQNFCHNLTTSYTPLNYFNKFNFDNYHYSTWPGVMMHSYFVNAILQWLNNIFFGKCEFHSWHQI